MMFLLRMAFWLTVVFVLLPGHPKSGGDAGMNGATTGQASHQQAATGINGIEALSAATAAVSDASSFCARQPQACAIGAQILAALGERAEAGAQLALSYVGTQIKEEKRKMAERAQGRPATDTLNAEDLSPAWRGLPPASVTPAVSRETPGAPVPLPPRRPASA